jgi:hypothetical protein
LRFGFQTIFSRRFILAGKLSNFCFDQIAEDSHDFVKSKEELRPHPPKFVPPPLGFPHSRTRAKNSASEGVDALSKLGADNPKARLTLCGLGRSKAITISLIWMFIHFTKRTCRPWLFLFVVWIS